MAYFGNTGQSSIDLPDAGIVGDGSDLASNSVDAGVFGASNGETATDISMGTLVKYGSTNDVVKLLSASSDISLLAGIVGFDYQLSNPEQLDVNGDGDGAIPPNVVMPIRRKERVNVRVAVAVALGDEVHVSYDASTNGGKGRFSAAPTSNKTIDCTSFMKWIAPAGNGGVAVLEFDMTNSNLAAADT